LRHGGGAVAAIDTAAGRGAVLLGVQRVTAGGGVPGYRRVVSGRPLLHLLHHPRGSRRGRLPARLRLPAGAAARCRSPHPGPHGLLRDGRGPGQRGDRGQLHVPADQAAAGVAPGSDGSLAVVHRGRRCRGAGALHRSRGAGRGAAVGRQALV
ncbi:MAG: ABC transporter, permease protein, putative, partial [uncultured Solirubrobacteraceae bacterium]